MTDPCFDTVLNLRNGEWDQIAKLGDAIVYRSFAFFEDSVSMLYTNQFGDGTGYDICGPQSFEIKLISDN